MSVAYLRESTWCSLSQTMTDEDLMVGPQNSSAGSSSLPVKASASYNSTKQLTNEVG